MEEDIRMTNSEILELGTGKETLNLLLKMSNYGFDSGHVETMVNGISLEGIFGVKHTLKVNF